MALCARTVRDSGCDGGEDFPRDDSAAEGEMRLRSAAHRQVVHRDDSPGSRWPSFGCSLLVARPPAVLYISICG